MRQALFPRVLLLQRTLGAAALAGALRIRCSGESPTTAFSARFEDLTNNELEWPLKQRLASPCLAAIPEPVAPRGSEESPLRRSFHSSGFLDPEFQLNHGYFARAVIR